MFISRESAVLGAKVAATAALGVAATMAIAFPASADGTSYKTFGCYSTWGNTGTSAHCTPATASAYFANHAVCQYQPDKTSDYIFISKGSYVDPWGKLNCLFYITNAYVIARG